MEFFFPRFRAASVSKMMSDENAVPSALAKRYHYINALPARSPRVDGAADPRSPLAALSPPALDDEDGSFAEW